jgi:hypothetical protein
MELTNKAELSIAKIRYDARQELVKHSAQQQRLIAEKLIKYFQNIAKK